MSAPENLLEVQELRVSFGRRAPLEVVRGVSFALARGDALAIVGESGSGKSTLGRVIAGLERVGAGTVRRPPGPVGIVFQDPAASLDPRLRVGDALAEIVRTRERTRGRELTSRIDELLARVGLPVDASARFPHELSGGERQRVAIARALAARPSLLVCDEVTSALDVAVAARVLALLSDLRLSDGLSLVFITHDLAAARAVASRVLVMYAGRIVEEGRVEDVLGAPRHPYTRALVDALPSLERDSVAAPLEGDPPSPHAWPTGCAFHPRCSRAEPRCASEAPPLEGNESARRSACWFAD